MSSDFWLGFVLGAALFAVFGRVLQQYLWSMNKAKDFFRPQTVTLQTRETPAQKLSGCIVGLLKLFLLLFLIALVWLLLGYLR